MLASTIASIGTNVALYIHVSRTMNACFDSFECRLESFERRFDLTFSKMVKIENKL